MHINTALSGKSRLENKEKFQGKRDSVLADISQALESDIMHTDKQTYNNVDSEKLEEKILEINQSKKGKTE